MRKYLLFLTFLFSLFISAQEVSAPLKVGDEIEVNLTSNTEYNNTNSGIVYFKEFRSTGSGYVKVYFENFDLNDNDYLRIYGASNSQEFIYTGSGKVINNNGDTISEFWSATIWDDHIIMELHSQNGNGNHYGFDISRVAYGYPINKITGAFETTSQQLETVCGGDEREQAACYDGTEIGRKSEAICRLLIGGGSLCTGWLLGTEGHVMTNNHCVENAADAANTEFWFNYRNTDCSGLNADATDIVATSATFIQTSGTLDFTLLLLPSPTDPNELTAVEKYGYLSLASTPAEVGDRIYHPQHPGGRRNEIAVTTDTNPGPGGFTTVTNAGDGGARVEYFHDTEGGSSGSPVLRYEDHLVIGLHNTGGCPNGAAGRSDEIINAIGVANMPAGSIDDPNPDTPRVSFGSVPSESSEGSDCNFQEITFNLRIAMPPSENADVTINTSGTATAGSDFEILTPNPITFLAGDDEDKQITLRIYNDGFVEGNEEFTLDLSLDANGGDASLAENSSFTHIIMDDDFTPDVGSQATLMSEDFETDLSNWTISGNGTTNFSIGTATDASSANWSANGNDTSFVYVNDDSCNCDMSEERLEYSTPIDLSNYNNASLNFDIKYLDSNDQYASDAFVQTSIDNGATWQNIGGEIPSSSQWSSMSIDLTPLIGQSNVLISFLYNDLGNWAYAMALDNISISGFGEAQIQTSTSESGNNETLFNGLGTMYVYESVSGNILAALSNNNNEAYECIDLFVSRSGTGAQSFQGSTAPDLAMDKQFNITVGQQATNGDVDVTFYFTEAEISGWENAISAAGGSYTRADLSINRKPRNGNAELSSATLGTYNGGVTLTGNFSNIDGVYSFIPQEVLSVNSNEDISFSVFPNPTKDILNIESKVDFNKIEIYNIVGKKIKSLKLNENKRFSKIDMTDLDVGLYFIKLFHSTNGQSSILKIMKN
ncbi:trypsin-like peptidase domain-containing protein [Winogradskyella jejuensis]|uniref:Por secretion system C-terminal sorting domain-containing protein n=1 Tax=Winogradskyella jejuensis TaxID=1089305 RepID=A0A1M5TWC3_9FLAO|nr:trypsin-like peptidase domain-containing protein [Winogradskyella jejuensis]SHH54910.1 Por secretion system C-terminal sorting domain-containing protein [Winogradskyella jejuensis]